MSNSEQLKNVWGWFEQASNHAKEIVSNAQNLATELSKQALEMKENYDAEVQKSILINLEKSSNHKILLPRENTQLEEIDLVYITENIIGMGFPHDPRKEMNIKGNRIDYVAGYLKSHHDSRYMIWNISEESYDYSLFGDQVLEYKFPGHPAPPLGLMFKICSSIESWLDADERNVAIVHCLTGKGRTAVVLACAMTWIGEFNSPMEALTYIAERKNSTIEILTIPSQRRYIQYFSNVLDGVRPRGEPLLLRRIIINGIPKYCPNPQMEGANVSVGCCPYIQLFKNGKIIANGLMASRHTSESAVAEDSPIRWINCSEESVSFQVDCVVQGDLLLRCRHHDPSSGARISMFRAAFHTGYVPSGVLRLTKAQLDGPNHDDRYSDDFYIDLIFAPVEKVDQTSHTGALSDAGATLDNTLTDKFEQMFHRDTRFWETISARKLKTKRRTSRKFQSEVTEKFSILDDGKMKRSTFELDDGDEVHFSDNAQSTNLSGDIFLSGPASLGASELSDDELIKQLAEAAENVDLDYSSGNNSGEVKAQALNRNQNIESRVLDVVPSSNESLSQTFSISASSARTELQALEDLEKELGLDLGTTAIAPSKLVSSNKDDDNLDDIEDFLESLNK